MSDEQKTEIERIAAVAAESLIGRFVDERREYRDGMIQKGNRGVTWNSVYTIVIGSVLAWMTWSNRQQLDNIALKQDKAVLEIKADISERYVTKQQFYDDGTIMKQAALANSAAILKLSDAIVAISTDVAVIKAENKRRYP